MTKYKCKKCGFEAEGDYWNEVLEGQTGLEDFVPIQDQVGPDLVWLCPACYKDTKVIKKEAK